MLYYHSFIPLILFISENLRKHYGENKQKKKDWIIYKLLLGAVVTRFLKICKYFTCHIYPVSNIIYRHIYIKKP